MIAYGESFFGYLAARQTDTERLRSWEVAGTAHADAHLLGLSGGAVTSLIQCDGINEGPQHCVIKAAMHALQLWITEGTAPATADPLLADVNGKPVTDEHGNTLGGIHTPAVDVPIATLSGQPAAGSSNILCSLFGSTMPFTPEKLLELYPTHDAYVRQVAEAAEKAREAGFILAPEAQRMIAEAESAPVPN